MTHQKTQFDWAFVGNSALVNLLTKQISKDRLSHAYCFWGAKHVGKETLVRTFAKSILCESHDSQTIPCNTCIHCKQFEKGIHPDVVWVKREYDEKKKKTKKQISIAQIRDLISHLETGTFLNSYKIGVISHAELLSTEAANSLLKTLEEPRGRAILILMAEQKSALPQTILSRCQIFHVQSAPTQDIANMLQKKGCDTANARIFSQLSFGATGQAIRYFENTDVFSNHKKDVQDFIELLQSDVLSRLVRVEQFTSKSEDHQKALNELIDKLNVWTVVLRDLFLLKHSQATSSQIQNAWYFDTLRNISEKIQAPRLLFGLDYIENAKQLLRKNINHKLLLDNFVLSL